MLVTKYGEKNSYIYAISVYVQFITGYKIGSCNEWIREALKLEDRGIKIEFIFEVPESYCNISCNNTDLG